MAFQKSLKSLPLMFFCFALLMAGTASAMEITVKDDHGRAVPNVAVALYARQQPPFSQQKRAEVEQKNLVFNPFVTVVPLGATVNFPNHDETKHHVYSFSKAKKIDLPLFLGKSRDVVFDKPGVVALGCNIHDWMLAYVVVVDTPYFTSSAGDGKAAINAPDGHYQLKYWYPGMKKMDMYELDADVQASRTTYDITIPADSLQKKPSKPTASADDNY